MSEVVLGSNHLVDCDVLLAIGQHPLLRIATKPLRVSLTTPPDWPKDRAIQVVDNRIRLDPHSKVHVFSGESGVAIFWGQAPLVNATEFADGVVSLRLELRPLGINLYDDVLALHAGNDDFSGNRIVNCSPAIAL